ncbi:hypothetical protein GX586_00995, partial [bacterium]|nr:hypothetical protein [bacterium]
MMIRTLVSAVFLVASLGMAAADEPLPAGEFIIRVYYPDIASIERLARYDLHEYNNQAERYVRVSGNADVYRQLEREGWRIALDEEATRAFTQFLPREFYGGYRSVDELYRDCAAVTAAHPAITEIVKYGESQNKMMGGEKHGTTNCAGYDLIAVRVANRQVSGPKPVFFLMANIHAREVTTPEMAMRFLDWLTRSYSTNADARWIVDHQETYIVPTANPDGHFIVSLHDPPYTQRKNGRRGGSAYWPPNGSQQYGVDCNRNHSYMWGASGSSTAPMDLTYRGAGAASEPEVSNLEAFVSALIPDQRGPAPSDPAPETTAGILVSLHSYSELVLWPWGYGSAVAPNNAGLQRIGQKFTTYNSYTPQKASQLYYASGDSVDWAYGALGIPAYTFECGTTFIPPYGQVDSDQWPRNFPALVYAA